MVKPVTRYAIDPKSWYQYPIFQRAIRVSRTGIRIRTLRSYNHHRMSYSWTYRSQFLLVNFTVEYFSSFVCIEHRYHTTTAATWWDDVTARFMGPRPHNASRSRMTASRANYLEIGFSKQTTMLGVTSNLRLIFRYIITRIQLLCYQLIQFY